MTGISRDLTAAAGQSYDLIIVGGGIYGAMLSLEASRQGLKSLLLEREDFGSATSLNSLRIIHGGFRYLQNLDIRRFFESVRERRWFLQHFPHLVKPLPCLMPLYGRGARTPAVLSAALSLNDWLSSHRNDGVSPDNHLPPGSVISAQQVKQYFPSVQTEGLKGGAIWYDAGLDDPQRLLVGLLRRSCALGGVALNYVEARTLLKTKNSVAGVCATDCIGSESYEYRAPIVVNAAGPWCREVAAAFDRDISALFNPSLAWNVLFDREAPSTFTLAIAPNHPNARTYILRSWKGKLLAGTVHSPWSQPVEYCPKPSEAEVLAFIKALNATAPDLDLRPSQIQRIYAGFLPIEQGKGIKLSKREIVWNHEQHHGPTGLYSVSGVKFTTSHWVAEKTLATIFPDRKLSAKGFPIGETTEDMRGADVRGVFACDWNPGDAMEWQMRLRQIADEESVQHLDDLVFRRTSLGDTLKIGRTGIEAISRIFNWDDCVRDRELHRFSQEAKRLHYRSSQ
ncbi:FAD-dependent oxidoreductase [Altericista sp. CCNU0014]|uniref:FAD-dependent oxidoreductase n=1 Tax=Altericista sp. CCNU0014 TaxID=3082949 RepID=UPI00384CF9CF